MMEFVSWDYDIPNIWKTIVHVPNHQPARGFPVIFLSNSEEVETSRSGDPLGKVGGGSN